MSTQNLVGQKFGKLLVLSRKRKLLPNGKYLYIATCKCDCGNIKDFVANHVKYGRSKSCGCDKSHYKNTSGEKNPCFTGYKEIRGKMWNNIKKRAKDKGIDVSVTLQEIWELYEKQDRKCALTGLPICFDKNNGETTASLDRIDSSGGYTIDNIQWVHKDVNKMKNAYDIEYFIKMCKLVSSLH